MATTEKQILDKLSSIESLLQSFQKDIKKELFEIRTQGNGSQLRTPSHSELREIFENLTERQHAVLQLALKDKTYTEMAEALDATEGTVKAHLNAVYNRLGISKRGPYNKRRWLKVHILPYFENFDNALYMRVARIPKDWAENKKLWTKYQDVFK